MAAARAKEVGISVEIIDLRTILPWDEETVINSIKKTGRCIVTHEAPITCGFGAELAAKVQEKAFDYLEAPVRRVCGYDTPFPLVFEPLYLPDNRKLFEAIKESAPMLLHTRHATRSVPLLLAVFLFLCTSALDDSVYLEIPELYLEQSDEIMIAEVVPSSAIFNCTRGSGGTKTAATRNVKGQVLPSQRGSPTHALPRLRPSASRGVRPKLQQKRQLRSSLLAR